MKDLFERIAKFQADRSGLPPKLHVELDCFEDAILEACITDEHADILFTAGTNIKNDGTAVAWKMAHATPDYRIAEILVDGYNGAAALLRDCQSAITELQRELDATQKRFELASENAAMLGCENSELKERVERAEALLRVLSGCMPDKVYVMDEKWSSEEPDDGDFALVDFAAYFR